MSEILLKKSSGRHVKCRIF